MRHRFEAIYESGMLRPLEPLDLPEHSIVHVSIMDGSGTELSESPRASSGLTCAEFDRLLDELASDGPTLPADFSRADIYADHD